MRLAKIKMIDEQDPIRAGKSEDEVFCFVLLSAALPTCTLVPYTPALHAPLVTCSVLGDGRGNAYEY